MPGVETKIVDTREIKVPVPAEQHETVTLGDFISNAAREGYRLSAVAQITSGHQRDPYVVGVRLTMKREES